MDYELARLGDRQFENLASSLFEKAFGVEVEQFGVGPDGGREAVFEGPTGELGRDGERWDGYVVLQAKFRARPSHEDGKWFVRTLKKELDGWRESGSPRYRRRNRPQYMVIATNVVLTPASGGGIETAAEVVEYAKKTLGLRDLKIWHHDKICRMLDDAKDIRSAYAALVTSGDVLAKINELIDGDAQSIGGGPGSRVGDALKAFTSQCLSEQRSIRLTESGSTGALNLEQIGVDLPCGPVEGSDETDILKALIDLGDQDLRPGSPTGLSPTYLVLGGPGQGKSTLSKMLAQVYRVAMLETSRQLSPRVKKVMDDTSAWMLRSQIKSPRKRRWPIRIDLTDVMDGDALIQTICKAIEAKLGYRISAVSLFEWLKYWSWALILDGLDEVASRESRDHVATSVLGFLDQAASQGCDLLTVITTRPQGYDNDFDFAGVSKIVLSPLDANRALDFADTFAKTHFADDVDSARVVVESLREASVDPNVSRLLQTPLQATIMTLLMESHGRAPRSRYLLFDAYYQTVYKREAAKNSGVSAVLNEFRSNIEKLHEDCGMRLQILSEQSGSFDAALEPSELSRIACDGFMAVGYEEGEAQERAETLVKAATERLVLLVPKGDGFGFEVRSIQEYLAGRAVARDEDDAVICRMHELSRAAHWRNVWLFAFGQCTEMRPHLEARLIDVVKNPGRDTLARYIGISIELAVALVEEGLWETRPNFRGELLNVLLDAFESTPLPFAVLSGLELLWGQRSFFAQRIRVKVSAIEPGESASKVVSALCVLEGASIRQGPLRMLSRHFAENACLADSHRLALSTLENGEYVTRGAEVQRKLDQLLDSSLFSEVERDDVGLRGFERLLASSSATFHHEDDGVAVGVRLDGESDSMYPVTDDGRIAVETALASISTDAWLVHSALMKVLWRHARRAPVDLDSGQE